MVVVVEAGWWWPVVVVVVMMAVVLADGADRSDDERQNGDGNATAASHKLSILCNSASTHDAIELHTRCGKCRLARRKERPNCLCKRARTRERAIVDCRD